MAAMVGRRIQIDRAGGYDRLRLAAFDPTPAGPGEVQIEATACGVNYADCVVRMGLYASAKEYVGWPITPGFEVCGRVAQVGAGVDDIAVGDRVIGVTRFFGYASHLTVPRHQVFAVPEGWTDAQAAAFPSVHLTAWYGLIRLAAARAGDGVLIHSAAGGVGTALVQLARIVGCRVVGVVGRPEKVDQPQQQGAANCIDKSSEDLWPAVQAALPDGADIVLDANGVQTLGHSYDHLRPGGRLVVYGFHTMLPRATETSRGDVRVSWPKLAWSWLRTPRFNPLDMTTTNRSVLAFNLSFMFDRTEVLAEAMGWLLGHCATGAIRPPEVTTYPLDKAADAQRALETGRTRGKLVLLP